MAFFFHIRKNCAASKIYSVSHFYSLLKSTQDARKLRRSFQGWQYICFPLLHSSFPPCCDAEYSVYYLKPHWHRLTWQGTIKELSRVTHNHILLILVCITWLWASHILYHLRYVHIVKLLYVYCMFLHLLYMLCYSCLESLLRGKHIMTHTERKKESLWNIKRVEHLDFMLHFSSNLWQSKHKK